MGTYVELAREAMREIREARSREGLVPQIAVGAKVLTPIGVGVLLEPAFAGMARVSLPEDSRHLGTVVDLPWEEIRPLVN